MPRVKNKRRFGRTRNQKKALLVSLSRNLILNERIKTTQARAKELRRFVEPIITKSKVDTVFSKRRLSRYFDEKTVQKLTTEIGPKYKERAGGYTRIIKIGPRISDGAEEVFIELV